jgi:hypothetical protein
MSESLSYQYSASRFHLANLRDYYSRFHSVSRSKKSTTPAGNVPHPREELHEVSARKSCSCQARNKVVHSLYARISFGHNRRGIICDRHDHRRGGSAKVIVPRCRLCQEAFGEQDCFIKLWGFEGLDNGFTKALMGSLAHFTPSAWPLGRKK